MVALFGRAGAPVDSLAQDDPARVLADATVLTWSRQQRSTAPLLVLTGSATRSARLSDEPVYDNGGGLTRTWRTVPLVNGVWAGRTGPKGPALARVQVGGYDGGVEVRGGTEPDPDDDVYDYASADYRLVSLVSDFARSHQVPAEDIDPHVLYDGGNGAGTFLVVALHLPDGTAFQTALVENRFPDGTSYTTYPVQGRPVAAADADHHPVVYVEASADDAGSSPVRVVAPGAALVRIVGGGAAGLAALGDGRDQGQPRGLRHAEPARLAGLADTGLAGPEPRRRRARARPLAAGGPARRGPAGRPAPVTGDAPPVPAPVRGPAPDARGTGGVSGHHPVRVDDVLLRRALVEALVGLGRLVQADPLGVDRLGDLRLVAAGSCSSAGGCSA